MDYPWDDEQKAAIIDLLFNDGKPKTTQQIGDIALDYDEDYEFHKYFWFRSAGGITEFCKWLGLHYDGALWHKPAPSRAHTHSHTSTKTSTKKPKKSKSHMQ